MGLNLISGYNGGRWWLTAVLLGALVAFTAAQGSENTPSCGSKLTPCLDYINATRTPPPACCDSLKEAVTNERSCLCSIYNNTDLLDTFKINVTQALSLPKLCHIDTGKSDNICEGVSPSSSSTGSASASTPPAGSGYGSKSSGWAISVIGLISTLLLFGTST